MAGKYVSEVGPGESGKIAGEEADEQENAETDPRIEQGGVEGRKVGQRDRAKRVHAAGERDVSAGGADDDDQEDEIFARGQSEQLELA